MAEYYSKSDYVYISGKCKWAHLVRPKKWSDNDIPAWEITVYPNEEGYNKLMELKTEHPAIKNAMKKDEDGYFMKFRRVSELNKRDGRRVGMSPPVVKQADGETDLKESLVGNGSDVTVKLEVYRHRGPGGPRDGRAVRLAGVRVDNLVPFNTSNTPSYDKTKLEQGIKDQPPQLF